MAEPTEAELKVWRDNLNEKKVGSELAYAMTECGVPLRWQSALADKGFTNLRLVAGLEETRAAVRVALTAELELGDTVPNYRLIMASLISTWEVCKEQLHKEVSLRAETKALQIRRPIGTTERTQMKRLVGRTHTGGLFKVH